MNRTHRTRATLGLVAAATLALSACGGGSGFDDPGAEAAPRRPPRARQRWRS